MKHNGLGKQYGSQRCLLKLLVLDGLQQKLALLRELTEDRNYS